VAGDIDDRSAALILDHSAIYGLTRFRSTPATRPDTKIAELLD
jgi:hypothetical protein